MHTSFLATHEVRRNWKLDPNIWLFDTQCLVLKEQLLCHWVSYPCRALPFSLALGTLQEHNTVSPHAHRKLKSSLLSHKPACYSSGTVSLHPAPCIQEYTLEFLSSRGCPTLERSLQTRPADPCFRCVWVQAQAAIMSALPVETCSLTVSHFILIS